MNTRSVGIFYEQSVKAYLENNGLTILEMNFRCKIGEIDIIAMDGKTLVFIEVKYRKNANYGNALEAVNYAKQKKIKNIAKYYLLKSSYSGAVRFDVIGITGNNMDWIKNAFC